VKPARDVVVGDRLEITKAQERWTVVVAGLADRRGPANVAQSLYEETPESAAERQKRRDERRLARPLGSDLSERPTKRDRRRLDALRRGQKRS
jgi:ribosome-associated heat shock protein Hsp15